MNDKVNFRMCAACRKIIPKDKLIRIAKTSDGVVVDLTKKSGGRGAYICSVKCLEMAQKGRKIERNLKCSVSSDIYNEVKEVLERGEQ